MQSSNEFTVARVSQEMKVGKFWGWAAGVMLVASYVFLANDSRHHWHEFRYLYSAAHYSTSELMQGVFDPGPAPVMTLEEVAAWYATELFHIYILRQAVDLFGVGMPSYTAIKLFYGALFVLAAELFRRTLQNLGMAKSRAMLVAALFLFSPLTVYLGFKLMGEAPSFLFAACAVYLFTRSLGARSGNTVLYFIGAGVALSLSMAASGRMPLVFLGFWMALVLAWIPRGEKKHALIAGVATWSVSLASMGAVYLLLGGSGEIYYSAVTGFMGFTKKQPVWMFALFNLGIVGMGLWLILPLAWASSDKRSRRFFLLWLVFSALPIVATTSNFMEPRYLVTAIIPFVGLAALGIEALWERFRDRRLPFRAALASLLVFLLVGGSAAAQSVMPYETDAKQLIQAVRSEASDDSTVILVPWNYTDFHLLRFVFPQKPIYLVQSAVMEGGEITDDPVWRARRTAAYGNHFWPEASYFPQDLRQRKVVFIGWTILPSLQNLHHFVLWLGLDGAAGYLDPSRFMNHMSQSWLWQSRELSMRETARFGQYHVFELQFN